MTLHWWMHWFWVTLLLALLYCNIGLSAPQSEELQHLTPDFTTEPEKTFARQGRAMYFTKPPSTTTIGPSTITVNATPSNVNATNTTNKKDLNIDSREDIKAEAIQEPTLTNTTNKELTEIKNDELTVLNKDDLNKNDTASKLNLTDPVTAVKANQTALNNTTQTPITDDKLSVIPNVKTTPEIATQAPKRRNNLTKKVVNDFEAVESKAESRIVTEKPLSLETSYLQTRIPPSIESSRRIVEPPDDAFRMDTGVIAGISFAGLVVLALVGSTVFVLYRRRYLNKPQTLNDKCSNPDSSGYLDDSTIRDNSEEMYSLDNDSFLNSLEAMTIQNYWTDTVKHTKL